MSFAALLPPVSDLRLEQVVLGEECLTLVVRLTTAQMSCPRCGLFSRQIHSRARRTIGDLAVAGRRVQLSLQVRRFFCRTPTCPQRTFREQIPALAARRGRRTQRLQAILCQIGFALGGEAGARLAAQLGMPCSPDTLLRLVRKAPAPPVPTPRVLGIDDWSFLRGKIFGTILLDLERRVPIDLLPDREVESCVAWLEAHPGIEIISRDRGETYAEAARLGAPQAKQVADRWHLLKNLGEALQKVVARHAAVLQQVAREVDLRHGPPTVSSADPPPPVSPAGSRRPPPATGGGRRAQQLETYQQIRELNRLGWTYRAIAAHLHIDSHTVSKYAASEQFIEPAYRSPRPAAAEPYRAYLQHRWAEGETNRRQLWNELQAQGYSSSYKSVWSLTRSWVPPPTPQMTSPPPEIPARPAVRTVRQVAWLLQKQTPQKERDLAYREALCQACPDLALAAQLVQAFGLLLRERQPEALDGWIAQAEKSGLRELRRFALGLHQDYAAVRAALEEPWSQGPTEGHIQRLKTLKRQMYGRASFGLLRRRVLECPEDRAAVPMGCYRVAQ